MPQKHARQKSFIIMVPPEIHGHEAERPAVAVSSVTGCRQALSGSGRPEALLPEQEPG